MAPTIAGQPSTEVVQQTAYAFTPTADDANGDALTFIVENLPGWASFDTSTGALTGTPGAGDIGMYSNVRIGVSDGEATTWLAAFAISVQAVGDGAATLSWMPPTQNTDGTVLTNLAGYTLHWGKESGDYTGSVDVDAGLTSYVIDNLSSGEWYFAARAYNESGIYSDYSNEVVKALP